MFLHELGHPSFSFISLIDDDGVGIGGVGSPL
jgi:hypothetical protein